jgi:hypothetical protein
MTPFNGDRVRPRVTARAAGKTFSWLFDTDASITCMTAQYFHAAFPTQNLTEYKTPNTALPPLATK